MTTVRIPGKVMLSGEYAVLHGGTAAMMPVPRHLTISEVRELPRRLYSKVVRKALAYPLPQLRQAELARPPLAVDIDYTPLVARDSRGREAKLGLGVSAAEAVGVLALRFSRVGLDWAEHRGEVLDAALEVHRRAQGVAGSGADVAACAWGEPVLCRRNGGGLKVTRWGVEQRPFLPLALVWTGQPADTRLAVQRFNDWVREGGGAAESLLWRLIETSNRLAPAWRSAAREELFALHDEFAGLMRECATAAGLDWESEAHRELEAWARQRGGRAKPTGAGGGDMVLLTGDLPHEELARHGALVIHL